MQERGYTVYELSRRAEGMPDIRHIVADITKEETLQAAVEQVLAVEGRLDLVVNNAGFGISGAIEFTDTQEAQRLFDTLFFGMVRMNRCVIPLMRQQGHGRIVNISSVAAPVPIPFQAYYSAGKGRHQRLYHGAGQRAAALRRHRLRRDARRYQDRLHRRPA